MLDRRYREALTPKSKPTIMSLAAEAGLDVSEWANVMGGAVKASSNPKYCYEWSFEQAPLYILNIWLENMQQDEQGVFQSLNPLTHPDNQTTTRRRRALGLFTTIKNAYERDQPVRAIVLERTSDGRSRVKGRMLDPKMWTVTRCGPSGDVEIRRDYSGTIEAGPLDDEAMSFTEGQARERFMKYRHREGRLRDEKLREFLERHGRIYCEVPGCGFDFEERYGEIGRGFAEVHHLDQMKDAPEEGRQITLDRLAVVCANCHAMIHRGGECRSLGDLVPKPSDHG